jgi:hypothetical protein
VGVVLVVRGLFEAGEGFLVAFQTIQNIALTDVGFGV